MLKKFLPSAFSMTLGWPDSMTATQEFVVPRSIPTILKKINMRNGFMKGVVVKNL